MNILLTSVGRRTYMVNYFKEALAGRGKVYASNSCKTYSFDIADGSTITPLIYNNNYIDFLINYSIKNHIKAIIPLFDIDLPILALNKWKFVQNKIEVIVSDYDTIQICNDKLETYQFLTRNGFSVPASYLTINEAINAINNNEIQYPLIIKPRWGMGSICIFQAENEIELNVLYKKIQKEINESYLKYESSKTPDDTVVIQEKIVGEEYGVDILNDLSGKNLASIPKKKIAMRSGETDGAEIIKNEELSTLGIKIAKITKHIGNLDLDCFLWEGKFYILEMNCRFGGQYPFCHLAGANFPKAIIQMLLKEKVKKENLNATPGVIGFKDINPVILQ